MLKCQWVPMEKLKNELMYFPKFMATINWISGCPALKFCLTQPKTGLILLSLWMILDVFTKTKCKKFFGIISSGLGILLCLYQMLLDRHYQWCAFGLMTPQSVSMVHLSYLDVEKTANLFPLLLLTLFFSPCPVHSGFHW